MKIGLEFWKLNLQNIKTQYLLGFSFAPRIKRNHKRIDDAEENFLVPINPLRVIAETSFESQRFQEFVSTGAERWLEVIQDWTNYGKVVFSFSKRFFLTGIGII